jgi:1-acyl-sn-glycerol-3-phosphate acyltransferase
VGDAEIIPLGTRGRPGRGSGNRSPSASSRNLAGSARARASSREEHPSARSAPTGRLRDEAETSEKADEITEPAEASWTGESPEATESVECLEPTESARAAKPVRVPAQKAAATRRPSAERAPVTAEERQPTPGIAPHEWLAALTEGAKEVFGADWEPRLAELLAFLRRRLTGEFDVDEFGFDREVTERFLLAALRPIAQRWFRIEVLGAENVPASGGALVVSNHSGTVPVDGLMTAVSIHDHTGRFLRPLGADLVFKLPLVGDLARKGGATLACNEDAERMLRGGELVGVWPEGFKGIGKPFSERYKLQRFGRGGFVAAAIRTGVPIVPTSVVGAEEIYPLIGNVPSLARLLGVPYLPITPFFPLLGPLGLIPLPSKWLIEFGEPIRTDEYDEGSADDPMLVFNVTDQVRESIQQTLYSLLGQRTSVFS